MDFLPGKPFSTDNYLSLQLDSVCTRNGCAELGTIPRSRESCLRPALSAAGLPGPMDRYRRRAGR